MNLYLFTDSFPYGGKETFIENEIPVLSKGFDKVYIFPWNKYGIKREIPSNCFLIDIDFGQTKGLKNIMLFNLGNIFKIVIKDILSRDNRKALKRPKAYWNDLMRMLYESEVLKSELNKLNDGKPSLYYTYWFYTWTNILSLIKTPKDKLITRSHGYDYNLERNGNGYFPFRPYTWSKIDANFNVSEFGATYLRQHYSRWKNKIFCTYLGVKEQKELAPFDYSNIVSCSNIIPLKRVHLIVEVLKGMKEPIHWTHFGDGSEKERIQELCKSLPSNITYELKGSIENKYILEWYKTKPVSAFLHFSSTEGLPVSMMEAQSFGIPILACDVGGVSEIVVEDTGYLLNKEFEKEEALNKLQTILNWDKKKRNAIQENQKLLFSSKKNYKNFINIITTK